VGGQKGLLAVYPTFYATGQVLLFDKIS
jgi:hypothetical protein